MKKILTTAILLVIFLVGKDLLLASQLLLGVGPTKVIAQSAPADATYITQTANGSLSAEQALGTLSNGILKNTTTTGVLSIATPSTDYEVSTKAILSANRTTAVTTYADITDLSFSLAASTRYEIVCRFIYNANATTTGLGISWTGPASPTLTSGLMLNSLSGGITVGGTVSVGNDTGGVTASSTATTNNAASFEGFWSNGSNAGTLQMRFRSEVAVASAIVILAGSWCKSTVY